MPRHLTNETILDEARDYYQTFGFMNYTALARRLSTTRQTIQTRISQMHRDGIITTEEFHQLRPLANDRPGHAISKPLKVAFSPENATFLSEVSDNLKLHKSHLVEVALTRYREATHAKFKTELKIPEKTTH